MGIPVVDGVAAVALDTLLLMLPLLLQLADGPLREHRQIPIDEPGVLARQLHLTVEAQVVTDEHLRAGNEPGREGFVVAVAQTQHEPVVAVAATTLNLNESEVAVAFMTQGMGLAHDIQTRLVQRTLHLFHKPQVRNRGPGGGARRCLNFGNGGTLNGVRTAMKYEIAFHGVETTKAVLPNWGKHGLSSDGIDVLVTERV